MAPGDESDDSVEDLEGPADLVPLYDDRSTADVIEYARRRYGAGGGMLAAGMLGLDIALGNKKKPDSVQVQEASSDPVDVDTSGISVIVDERTEVAAPPLERREPLGLKKKRSRR